MCPKVCTSGTTSSPCALAWLSTALTSPGLRGESDTSGPGPAPRIPPGPPPAGTCRREGPAAAPAAPRRGRCPHTPAAARWRPAPAAAAAPEGTEGASHLAAEAVVRGSGSARARRVEGSGLAKKSRGQQESRWRWLKAVFLLSSAAVGGLLSWNYLSAEDGVTEVLAHRRESLQDKFVEIPCSEDYNSHKRFEGCTPRKCGRGVTDAVITREEAERIRRIAERGLSLGGSDGGASILDLHSGALSLGKHFVNLYRYFGDKIQDIFTEEDFALYRDVRQRIQQRIAQAFGISSASMYLTKPTFFSRINSTEAKTTHDEYWHPHVDKASILDLHSGALSLGKHFVNLYRYFGDKIQDIFTEEDFALYR
ncbi:PREDICTED: 2-oxoglutarate and iron-dependent oxygenase domain-containing protein 3-like [Calidris pugnax]|uniref:2-oxoglutarate and iron-dependent oxygenase domain-containing protein 3-like n=1 Tax=Calidris pugnax TaxID=198806 RepID=UPI00071D18A8|nr:PREDICTED: 2-oxoglutarate and iron-dependent oxygenase domain-containing protein 3-like [Calidris pugnax]